jgi:hypothetical protein
MNRVCVEPLQLQLVNLPGDVSELLFLSHLPMTSDAFSFFLFPHPCVMPSAIALVAYLMLSWSQHLG